MNQPAIVEEVLQIGGTQSLVGIVSKPSGVAAEQNQQAVILINAGLLHRVGPNRIYVKIARALATTGILVLRLDLSGIGESKPRRDGLPKEQSVLADVRQAMAALEQRYGVSQFIVGGHCSGADYSMQLAIHEPRVGAAILINPAEGDDEWGEFDRQRKVATYYSNFYGRAALANRERVMRLLTGRADYRTIFGNVFRHILLNRVSTLVFRLRSKASPATPLASEQPSKRDQALALLRAVAERGTPLLVIHSEGSSGQQLLRSLIGDELDRLAAAGVIRVAVIPESDHIYNRLASQEHLIDVISGWMHDHQQVQEAV